MMKEAEIVPTVALPNVIFTTNQLRWPNKKFVKSRASSTYVYLNDTSRGYFIDKREISRETWSDNAHSRSVTLVQHLVDYYVARNAPNVDRNHIENAHCTFDTIRHISGIRHHYDNWVAHNWSRLSSVQCLRRRGVQARLAC